jgi:hypothetical protein
MTNLIRSNFQAHPFHLVSPSPWPLYTSIALYTLTTTGVLTIHGFSDADYFWMSALLTLILSMSFWWRDVISEGKLNTITLTLFSGFILKIVRAIPKEDISLSLDTRIVRHGDKKYGFLGYYLAGLLEGDGHISIPALGNSTLNRILNPRIIFTSHINNLPLYAYLQSKLHGAGRFQKVNDTVIRYIIGDIKSINLIVDLIHGKLRTPKNVTFNKLIEFMNKKSGISIEESKLDRSIFSSNSWLAGFTEADGKFYIKIIEAKNKSDTRKRPVSVNISLVFRLDQRAFDKSTQSSMLPVMKEIAEFFNVDLITYTTNSAQEVLSVSVTSLSKLSRVVNYFSTYNMLGIKHSDYLDWERAYKMFLSKEHLTETGREKIRLVKSRMNSKRII